MANNKVVLGDEVLIDLTEDTVTEDTLLEGETAHDASGNPITGRARQGASEASEVNYDDTVTQLGADNVQIAIEKLNDKIPEAIAPATTDKLGGVKIPTDGTITVDDDGTIHAHGDAGDLEQRFNEQIELGYLGTKNKFDISEVEFGVSAIGIESVNYAIWSIDVSPSEVYCASIQNDTCNVNFGKKKTGGSYEAGPVRSGTPKYTTAGSDTVKLIVQFYNPNGTITKEIIESVMCQVEKGNTATPYQPHGGKSNVELTETLSDNADWLKKDGSLSNVELTAKLSEITDDKEYTPTLIKDSYVTFTDGAIISYNGWDRTDYIDVFGCAKLELYTTTNESGTNKKYNVFFDANKKFISQIDAKYGWNIIEVPSNAHYFMCSNESQVMEKVRIRLLFVKGIKQLTEELSQLEYNKNTFNSFIVFSTQPWWSNYMAGFNYPKANRYNWSIQSVTLYKGNGETTMATTDFSVSTDGDAVRVGTKKTEVAGSMVAIVFNLTNK